MSFSVVKKGSVYIGLGSNLDEPYQQIKSAIKAIGNLSGTEVIQDSGYFKSKPMGPEDQPDYLNAVVEIRTNLTARELLAQCQLIEVQQGRIKTRHWGERSIDLDILLYENQQIEMKELTVPHPGIWQRDFVYMPLLKINQSINIPGKGLLAEIIKSEGMVNDEYGCRFVGKIE